MIDKEGLHYVIQTLLEDDDFVSGIMHWVAKMICYITLACVVTWLIIRQV